MEKLNAKERLQLMKFVCSFVWADLDVRKEERAFVAKMVTKLKLTPEEAKQVEGWLAIPPRPEEVDPSEIPRAHREHFLETVKATIHSDGEVHPDEQENLRLFEQLLK